MGLSKTPYEVQREQQERAIRAQEEQQSRALASQVWNDFANMDLGQPVKPQPTFDWQHGADIAAKRAQGLEMQDLEGRQKLSQIAAQGEQARQTDEYQMMMKLKYAPKKTGGGVSPISKIVTEIFKNAREVPENAENEKAKNARQKYLYDQLGKYGSRGIAAQQDVLSSFGKRPEEFTYGGGTKFGEKQAELTARLEREKAEQDARAAAEAERRRLEAINQAAKPPSGMGMESEEEAKRRREAAEIRQRTYIRNQPAAPMSKATSAPTAPAAQASERQNIPPGFVPIGDGRYVNPKTRQGYDPSTGKTFDADQE